MTQIRKDLLELFATNNAAAVEQLMKDRAIRWATTASPKLRKLHAACNEACTLEEKCSALAALLNAYDNLPSKKAALRKHVELNDARVLRMQEGRRVRYDNSGEHAKDYYSVAVIVKNEARYMKEFVLFYMATGADRIYVYDNESSDNLLEVLQPFINAGYVVYQNWPGSIAQTAAYRDAIRRLAHKTTWLALVDADEFLFSPKGLMPEQLKAYEAYAGVGVNWVVFGPSGHKRRPAGLVMDNYTQTFDDYQEGINHHIKSIVRPSEVLYMINPHFAFYKHGRFAVDERGQAIDNYAAMVMRSGRAFTRCHRHDTFRINHYCTRSLEDFEEKRKRGSANGNSNPDRLDPLIPAFEDRGFSHDHTIKPYADAVRALCEDW